MKMGTLRNGDLDLKRPKSTFREIFQMRRSFYLLALLAFAWPAAANAQTCPSLGTPPCASTGTTNLNGLSFGCIEAGVDSGGGAKVGVAQLSFTGAPPSGTVSGSSANNATDNAYVDFPSNLISGNYCFNSDNVSGFISHSGGAGSDCPIAFVYSASKNTLRLLNTKSNKEDVLVCRSQ